MRSTRLRSASPPHGFGRLTPGRAFLLALFILAASHAARAFDLPQYYSQNNNVTFHSKEEFLLKFPYDEYLRTVSFTDFKQLQKDRYFLSTQFADKDGDEFLYYLAERFLELYPVRNTPDELKGKIDLGEAYLKPNKDFNQNKNIDRRINEIYVIIGYFILNKVGQKIGSEIAANRYDESEPQRAAIIQRLAADRVYVSRAESATGKIIANFKQGKYWYLWQRAQSYARTHQALTQTLAVALGLASLVLLLAGLGTSQKWLRPVGVFGILVTAAPILLLKYDVPAADAGTVQMHTDLELVAPLRFYPANDGADHAVEVYTLLHKDVEIGQAIWLNRPAIDASYLAFENVPAKYAAFKAGHRIVLATSGGYTNVSGQPEGFTTEEGNVVNPVVMPDRHGLAMLSAGGINVLNMKDKEFLLPEGETIDNPLNSLLAYARLLEWSKRRRATLFQTHLLAYSDTMLIDPQKANPEVRERRILALARDKNNQRLYHVVFNVTKQYQLAPLAAEIFGLLQKRNLKVEAILNLDVGTFNILQVYDDSGNPLPGMQGPVDVNQATNLLVYTN